jgi:hypothetical protein
VTSRVLRPAGPDRLVALVGDVATMLAAQPLPTGARVDIAVGDDSGPAVAGKIIGAEHTANGFRLRVRLFSCPRERREALAALLEPEAPGAV